MDRELLALLSCELGHVIGEEELCPGVYYLTILPALERSIPCREYYLVLDHAFISQDARALGIPIDKFSALLYPIDPPDHRGWVAVMYEVTKYRLAHGLPNPDGWSPTDTARTGMELCPSYFGPFPVPTRTPWGWTRRHKVLDNGVYWIETSQDSEVLAVCNPVWSAELSDMVKQAGKLLADDISNNSDGKELAYLFFDKKTSCSAIFELLKVRSEWLDAGLIRKPELMNAIWKYAPMYAANYNTEEQAGLHDGFGILLYYLGEGGEPQGSPEHMISLYNEAGTDFIGFWK